uniref:Nicotinamide N-methyltransferase n=1 Tax=Leptobrachium leishanense TaxID=445787 RepID=A0A8C5PZQ1_9ANUR
MEFLACLLMSDKTVIRSSNLKGLICLSIEDTMEASLTKQELLKKYFNPKDYYDISYAKGKGILLGEWVPFVLKNLHELFSSGAVKGDTLTDIGSGSSIYHLVSACRSFKNITTSDLLEQNLIQQKKWLNKEPDMLDWSEIVQIVCDLEGNGEKVEEKEDKLRRAVRDVLKCDVLKKNPFEPLVLPPADCVLCCLCLESACKDVASYRDTVKNLKNLVKPGGHIIVLGTINNTYFSVNENKLPTAVLKEQDIKKAFTDGGYEILRMEAERREDLSLISIADFRGFYSVLARKPGKC